LTFDIAELLTLTLAIVSGWGAVLVGIFAQEFFRNRREGKKVKSLVIAYLDTVFTQLPRVRTMFNLVADKTVWTEDELEFLFRSVGRANPISSAPLEDEVRRNALSLPRWLADSALRFIQWVEVVNSNLHDVTKMTVEAKPKPGVLKSVAVSATLKLYAPYFKAADELASLVGNQASRLRTSLVQNKRFDVNCAAIEQTFEKCSVILNSVVGALNEVDTKQTPTEDMVK